MDDTTSKTNTERIIEYLWSVRPEGATNTQLRIRTGVEPHQQVFQITNKLRKDGIIRGVRGERDRINEWVFYALFPIDKYKHMVQEKGGKFRHSSHKFEMDARKVFIRRLNVQLRERQVGNIPKKFDMVSDDDSIIGDAKFYTLVRGKRLPPAKFATISEHIWLLEKTGARKKFLVFGNDRRVPEWWLKKYGHLNEGVDFYFMTDDGVVEKLR